MLEELQEELSYDPESGYFYWIKPKTGRPTGRPAGYTTHQGYRNIRIGAHVFLAHRLAFFFMTGSFPPENVGFKDNNPYNLKWSNLYLRSKEDTYSYVKEKLKCNFDDRKEQEKVRQSRVARPASFNEEEVQEAILKFLEAHE